MVSFGLGKEIEKDFFFCLVMSIDQGKDDKLIPISNRTLDLWVPCSDALPLSHRGYDEHGPLQISTPLHQYTYYTYCYPYISQGADKENLINNQELL